MGIYATIIRPRSAGPVVYPVGSLAGQSGSSGTFGPFILTRTGRGINLTRRNPRERSRFFRIVRRVARYAGLGLGLYVGGFIGGYYLTMATATTAAAALGVAGGIRAGRMFAEDLTKLGVDSRILRAVASAKVGGLFALLPLGGAVAGLVTWFAKEGTRALVHGIPRITRTFGTAALPFPYNAIIYRPRIFGF